ncbi:hypothetical protein M9458_049002, partial [Cirrhinus mrigala]
QVTADLPESSQVTADLQGWPLQRHFQKQTEAIKLILPRCESTKPPAARPLSAHHRERPPAASTSAPPPPPLKETTPQQGVAQPAPQALATKNTRKDGRDCSSGDSDICAPTPGGGPGGCTIAGASDLRVSGTHLFTKREIFSVSGSFTLGSSFERHSASSDSDLEHAFATIVGSGPEGRCCIKQFDSSSGRFASYAELPSPPQLPHRRYVTRSVDPTSTQIGGVINASQPITLLDPDGYAIQFTRRPPRYRGVLLTSVHSDTDAFVLHEEIVVLLAKDAIKPFPPDKTKSGFCSPYFIVPKKSGGLQPILDLRVLNR